MFDGVFLINSGSYYLWNCSILKNCYRNIHRAHCLNIFKSFLYFRCLISECDNFKNISYNAPWVAWATPPDANNHHVISVKMNNCYRYSSREGNHTDRCSQEMFTNKTERCTDWVFDGTERTIVTDVSKLIGQENKSKVKLGVRYPCRKARCLETKGTLHNITLRLIFIQTVFFVKVSLSFLFLFNYSLNCHKKWAFQGDIQKTLKYSLWRWLK